MNLADELLNRIPASLHGEAWVQDALSLVAAPVASAPRGEPPLFAANSVVAKEWGVEPLTPFIRLMDKETWDALLAQATPPSEAEIQQAFEHWWEEHGQFVRSGGGQYEKTFANAAWRHLFGLRGAHERPFFYPPLAVAGKA